MKKFVAIVSTVIAMAIASPVAVHAEEFTKGVVKKVDMKNKKVTIKHEELSGLDMPAMTMVFVPGDDAMLENMKEGAEIEFVADRVDGKLTVVKIK